MLIHFVRAIFTFKPDTNIIFGAVNHFLVKAVEINGAFFGASKAVGHTEIHGTVGQGIEHRRLIGI